MTRLKTGGRTAGTPNKRTQDLIQRLDDLGLDPLAGLAAIANDATAPLELRARVLADLMGYIYARRKSLDESAAHQASISINIGIPQPPKLVVDELQG